ncbi:MAG: sortase [Clostridia bacterium]|nr:sortase [Clostridia bacterium]
MGKKTGVLCIALGICLLASSVGLILYNRWEDRHAESESLRILQDVQLQIPNKDSTLPDDSAAGNDAASDTQTGSGSIEDTEPAPSVPDTSETVLDEQTEPQQEDTPAVPQMPTTKVDDYECIGILSIPVLNLELPVLTDWSYPKLKVAPCVYYGSYYEENFVIAGHNYRAHFKRFPELQPGDIILLTDVSGTAHYYEVVLLETLSDDATEQMITSGFDLSLYTCTPGGGTGKVTVRCNAITN